MEKQIQHSKNIIIKRIIVIFAVALSLFTIYTGGFGVLSPILQRTFHLTLVIVLVLLLYPIHSSKLLRWIDFLGIILAIGSCVYIFSTYEDLLFRVGNPNKIDIFFGITTVLIVLEVTRRLTGWILASIGALFIFYSYFGEMFPGVFQSSNMSTSRFVSLVYMSTDGLWGITLGVAATFVALFIVFGSFLNATGAGKVFIDLAYVVGGRFRGGPAKVAVMSSALMGTVSGSAVANVASTGQFTIPLMKSVGYKPKVAASVESVASTGGMIMPPIMGAGAFVMAEFTGIPYSQIIIAATIPAILYFMSIFIYVDLEAGKDNLKAMEKHKLPDFKSTFMKGLHLYTGVGVLVFLLVFAKVSPMYSAFWAIVVISLTYIIFYFKKVDWGFLTKALVDGAKGMLIATVACATAGIVVGVVNLTGIGVKLTTLLVNVGEASLVLTLIVTVVACIVMGMGLPPTASYILLAVLTAPALIKLDVEPLLAHMFIFYYACLAPITPPVALASFTGAGIAGSDPMKTSLTSAKMGLVAFVIPFMFLYGPELLGQGDPLKIAWVFVMAVVGVYILGIALTGWFMRNLYWYERVLAIVSALLLIATDFKSDIIGLILVFILFGLLLLTKKEQNTNLNFKQS